MNLRSVAERSSHRLVVRRRMPPPFDRTRIYVSSEGGLRFLRRNLDDVDPVLLDFAREVVRPGSVVWDVGANVGLFTFAAATTAGAAGRVVAVEPDTWMVHLLRRSLRIPNDRAPVDVLPVAVSAASGVGRFCIAARNRSTNHLDGFGGTQTGGVRSVQLVPTLALDDLLPHFPPPDVVKIDVEGVEHLVLQGAPKLLGDIQPTILCEVAAENAGSVAEILIRNGYHLFDAEQPAAARRPLTSPPWSTLAVAAARARPAVIPAARTGHPS
jgi:FkbM family methyltransferase